MGVTGSEVWRPCATVTMLQARADLLREIRRFMQDRGIVEVETPVLVHAPVTDVHIDSFLTVFDHPGQPGEERLYLHTSPEYAMKRLLADGSGPIYQVCKVFRNSEAGNRHNPEFTMLEWYRPGFDHHLLMDELNLLLEAIQLQPARILDYADAFLKVTQLDPHAASLDELQSCAEDLGFAGTDNVRATLLDFIFSHVVMPGLGKTRPDMVHSFPVCQAALSRLSSGHPEVAERFELFINGLEIANGFHELTDVNEQRRRFEADNRRRSETGKPPLPLDERLLAALDAGLPDCAGVALGIDRLLMAMHDCETLAQTLAFPLDRA